jgi:hypothetical protein
MEDKNGRNVGTIFISLKWEKVYSTKASPVYSKFNLDNITS